MTKTNEFLVRLMIGVVAFAGGTVMFQILHHEPPPPKPVIQKIVVTKEVPGPTKTITKNTVPPDCVDYLKAAQRTQDAVTRYETQVGELPQLIDEASVAIGGGSLNKLNGIRQRDIQLESDSIKALEDLHEAQTDMKSANTKCQQALKGN